MSRQNVEVVRRLFESYSRGDYAAAAVCLAPGVATRSVRSCRRLGETRFAPCGRGGRPREKTSRPSLRKTVPEEFIDAGEHVVVTVWYSARGRGSGIEYNDRPFDVYTLNDGQCVRKREFREQSDALEAAGLR